VGNIPDVDRDEAAREITECVAQLFFSAENQSRFHGASEELGVSPPMLKCLFELEPGDRVAMRDLAERWGFDASFVTVMCDGLEAQGLVRRRVAEHDRRIKVVELTDAGEAAIDRVTRLVYGQRAGYDALSAEEQATLAQLLRRVADAQEAHDEELLAQPDVKAMARRLSAQRTRAAGRDRGPRGGGRGRGGGFGGGLGRGGGRHVAHEPGEAAPWKAHLDAYRRELVEMKEQLARVQAEIKAQARGPIDDAKADLKAAKATAKEEAKAATKAAAADIKAQAKAAADDVVRQLKAKKPRR
jgi:DNA-binding MarR family transcriptional regulator